MRRFLRFALHLLNFLFLVHLTGCATTPMMEPRASAVNAAKFSDGIYLPVALDIFKLAPNIPPGVDESISIRMHSITPPSGGSFSRYLSDTLKVELVWAGLYDPQSITTIAGVLTVNEVEASAFVPGRALLGARFKVSRGGMVRFEREFKIESSWANAFAGFEAIPVATAQYTIMYRKLVGALFDDPEFRKALAKE